MVWRRPLLAGLLLTVAACKGGESPGPTGPSDPVATTISLSVSAVSFAALSETHQLTATVVDQTGAELIGASVAWASSDAQIASVSETGLVTALDVGSATITATSGSASATAAVAVAQAPASVSVSGTLSLAALGDTTTLTASVSDAGGSVIDGASLVWSSSDAQVASVDNAGLVTAISQGVALIIATSGPASGAVPVTVEQVAVSMSLSPTPVDLAGPGDTVTVAASVLDAGGSEIANPALTWSSDDEATATVSSTGLVTAVAAGSATITAEVAGDGQPLIEAVSVNIEDGVPSGPGGGQVSVADGAVSLDFPAGALAEVVFITAEPATDLPSGTEPIPGTAFDFGPDGIVFEQPVTLTIAYDPANVPPGVPEDELRLHKLANGGYSLVEGSTVDVANHTVSGLIDGFSVFVILRTLRVTTTLLPDGIENVDYGTQALTVTGGSGTNSWSLASGSLPTGLNLQTNGVITGTPTTAGTSHFTLQVTSGHQTAQQALSITVHPTLMVTTTSLAPGITGVAYGEALSATGGDGSYVWAVTAGVLPTGLSLNTSVITGTPSVAGTLNFTVQVTSAGQTAQQALSITVNTALQVTTTSLPNGAPAVPYSETLTATGGGGSYSWALIAGSLPAGLTLSTNGDITGTPAATGTSDFTVEVTSADGQTDQQALSINVTDVLAVFTSTLPDGVESVDYGTQMLVATGGDGAYSWTLASGSLPTGLVLSGIGAVSGTPSTAGTSNFTVEVTSGGQTAQRALSITVVPVLVVVTTSLPDGIVDEAYSETLIATGGVGSYSWSLTSGSLPMGLSLAGNGEMTGTPTGSGTSNFTVEVTDGTQTAQQVLAISVQGLPTTVTDLSVIGQTSTTLTVRFTEVDDGTGAPARYVLRWNVTPIAWGTASGEQLLSGTQIGQLRQVTITGLDPGTDYDVQLVAYRGTLNVDAVFSADLSNIASGTTFAGPILLPTELCSDYPDNAIATFEEADLEAAVKSALGLGQHDDLTCALLGTLTSLTADDLGITSLVGIQNLTSLTDLGLFGNSITDISPLDGLTSLTSLVLRQNSIVDITALGGLTNLTTLALQENSITDISPLSGLTSLSVLGLNSNLGLSDVQPLLDNAGLGAGDFVGLTDTNVSCTDVAALQAKGVTVSSDCLVLQPSEFCSDYPDDAIATFENEYLEMGVRSALGLGPQDDLTCGLIGTLTDLTEIEGGFSITSGTGLQNLTSLNSLNLSFTSVTDLSPLSGLTGLTYLSLTWTYGITDISPLSGLTSLTVLYLNRTSTLIDISPLAGLTSLTTLDLDRNQITDISPLNGLTSLTYLDLHENGISEIGALSELTSLTGLELRENAITDIGALSGLTSLTDLDLRWNAGLTNIQPLLDNSGLGAGDDVDLTLTSVSCSDVNALEAKGVSVNHSCLAITTTSLPDGAVNVPYSETLTATGGNTEFPYTWALVSGSDPLPAGLSLSEGGDITGTPTMAGTSNFTVEVITPFAPVFPTQKALSITVQVNLP